MEKAKLEEKKQALPTLLQYNEDCDSE